MAETRSTTASTQEAIALLKTASDHQSKEIQEMRNHHDKEIQEICTIQGVHTRAMNEMTQRLAILVQRSNSNQGGVPRSPTYGEPRNANSSTMAIARTVRLEFPRFFGEDPASWVYKANQYFRLQLSLGLSASLSFLSSPASNHHHDLAVLLRLSHRVLSLRVEESNLVSTRSLTNWILSYVVDVADPDNMKISSSEHYNLLSKPSLSGIPLLVPGNQEFSLNRL